MIKKHYYIVFIMIIQVSFLLSIMFLKWWNIQNGEHALVEIQGYDPYDHMRGYYSRITPKISNDDGFIGNRFKLDNKEKNIYIGKYVYVPYYTNDFGIMKFNNITLDKPKNKYIRGVIKHIHTRKKITLSFIDNNNKVYLYENDSANYDIERNNLGNIITKLYNKEFAYYITLQKGNNYNIGLDIDDNIYFIDNNENTITRYSTDYSIDNTKYKETLNAKLNSIKMTNIYDSIDVDFKIDAFYGDKYTVQKLDRDLLSNENKKFAKVSVENDGDMNIIEIIANNNVYK